MMRLNTPAMNRRALLATAAGGAESVKSADLRDWLAYIASDELEGRAVFTTERTQAP